MAGVLRTSRLLFRHALARGLSVALIFAASATALESIQLWQPGADQGKGWCAEARGASASGLDQIAAEVDRYGIRVVSVAEQKEKEAQVLVDEARRLARVAERALTKSQEELARLEEALRAGARGSPPDAALLQAEAQRYQVEREIVAFRGRADYATRRRAEYERVRADPDSRGTFFTELLKRELDAAERIVAEESGRLQTLLAALEGLRLQVRAGRLRQGGPEMVSADTALWEASMAHRGAVWHAQFAQLDLDRATDDANRARANRDEGRKCIADRRAQLAAAATPPPGTGAPAPPPVTPPAVPRSDFATTFFLTRFGWESGMAAARPVEPYLGGLYFHPDGTVTGWLQSAGSLSGTWQGTSAKGTLKLNGGLEGEWRLTGLAFGSDALGGPIATAGQGAWCAGRLKALHYFGGITPTPTNFPGADDRPRPGLTPPPADAEAMCKTP